VIIDIPTFLTLRDRLPVVDVRSENEFLTGHIPSAINIPILNNSERVVVGTTYKQHGQQEAIREGFRLVGPRLADIVDSAQKVGSEFIVHCWRGGMRSANFCQFVGMAGSRTHQVRGGYKAYRQYATEFFQETFPFIVLSGLTGSGKTEMLTAMRNAGEQVIDLEGLANHKGSVFGGLGQPPQPTTEQFQNNLFEQLHRLDRSRRIWIEDESIAVGKIFLPVPFWNSMSTSPIITVDVPKEVRTKRLVKEYGEVDREGFAIALKGITKKLGGQHYNAAMERVEEGDMYSAIDIILTYYDKAYATGLARKKDRIKVQLTWDGRSIDDIARELISYTKQEKFESVGR
jgi:tRNA 2-selenouridine synthase